MARVPFIKPFFPPLELVARDLEEIQRRNIYTNNGPFDRRLAKQVAEFISDKAHASIVSSGMSALMLSIRAVFKPSGRYVIMPSFTFAAGPVAVLWAGYEPLFIDIDLETWQPSLVQAREFLSRRAEECAGILLCNSFGVGNTAVSEWEHLSSDSGVPMVIDSAAGFGSEYESGKRVGTRGVCEIFSFHATKPFGIGEGGAVVSQSEELIERIERLKNFGFNNRREVTDLGLNAKISEMACAIGLRMLSGYAERLMQRRNVLSMYKDHLGGLTFQDGDELSTVPFISALLPDATARDKALRVLDEAGVEARAYYNPPLHRQARFLVCPVVSSLEVTEDVCSRIISLPALEEFQSADVVKVAAVIKQVVRA